MLLTGLIILILITLSLLRIGLALGYIVKQPATYAPSKRACWAFVCGIFPASASFTTGGYASLVFGVAIAILVYSRPQYDRYRLSRAAGGKQAR